jgi:hypothetical protein
MRILVTMGLAMSLSWMVVATGNPGARHVAAAPQVGLKAQVRTALASARLAAATNDVNELWKHLGRVTNCLVGPNADYFNPNHGNVCQGQGNGIGRDLALVPVPVRHALAALARAALDLSLAGSGDKELVSAKITAKGVVALLGVLDENLK